MNDEDEPLIGYHLSQFENKSEIKRKQNEEPALLKSLCVCARVHVCVEVKN